MSLTNFNDPHLVRGLIFCCKYAKYLALGSHKIVMWGVPLILSLTASTDSPSALQEKVQETLGSKRQPRD